MHQLETCASLPAPFLTTLSPGHRISVPQYVSLFVTSLRGSLGEWGEEEAELGGGCLDSFCFLFGWLIVTVSKTSHQLGVE